MDGITILSAEVVPAVVAQNYWWIGIIFVAGEFARYIQGVISKRIKFKETFLYLLCGVLLGLIISIGFYVSPIKPQPEYTKYEVTISDDVSLAEFNEKYEILEQRGEIYVIRERVEKEKQF